MGEGGTSPPGELAGAERTAWPASRLLELQGRLSAMARLPPSFALLCAPLRLLFVAGPAGAAETGCRVGNAHKPPVPGDQESPGGLPPPTGSRSLPVAQVWSRGAPQLGKVTPVHRHGFRCRGAQTPIETSSLAAPSWGFFFASFSSLCSLAFRLPKTYSAVLFFLILRSRDWDAFRGLSLILSSSLYLVQPLRKKKSPEALRGFSSSC